MISLTTSFASLDRCMHTFRDSFSVIKISGERVIDYLQGQITQDMQTLTAKKAIYAAVLTAQGKVVSDLLLMHGNDDEIIILCPTYSAENLVQRLRQFMLGYPLRLGMVSRMGVMSLQGSHVDTILQHAGLPCPDALQLSMQIKDDCIVLRKGEASTQGVWLIADRDKLTALAKSLDEHVDEPVIESARIVHGTSRFGIDWDESIFPLNANVIESEGVSFEKGCYVGQEVTSRMFWRKSIKKRLYHVKLSTLPSSLPCPVFTTAAIGMLTSAACAQSSTQNSDQNDELFGIAHLTISVVESGHPLSFEENKSLQVLGLSHA